MEKKVIYLGNYYNCSEIKRYNGRSYGGGVTSYKGIMPPILATFSNGGMALILR